MPLVEREMAALASLGPDKVSVNPHCPLKECDKTNHLVRSGRVGLRRTAAAGHPDTKALIDAALSAHSQLIHDVGSVMSLAMMTRRQVWLVHMTLPENIRKELTTLPVVPGRVFHTDSQSVLDEAEWFLRTRVCVQCTFSRTMVTRQRSVAQQHQISVCLGSRRVLDTWEASERGRCPSKGPGTQGSST